MMMIIDDKYDLLIEFNMAVWWRMCCVQESGAVPAKNIISSVFALILIKKKK